MSRGGCGWRARRPAISISIAMPLALSTAPLQIRSASPGGTADAEMVPMAEKQQAFAAAGAAADAAEDIVARVGADVGRHLHGDADRQGHGTEGRTGLIVEQTPEIAAGGGEEAFGGILRHRPDDRRDRLARELGRRPLIVAGDEAPLEVGVGDRDHGGGAGVGDRAHPLGERGEAGNVRRLEQDDHHRAIEVGAGELVDAALGQANAVAGEDHRRIVEPHLGLASLEGDPGLVEGQRPAVGRPGNVAGSASCARRGRPAGTRCRCRRPARARGRGTARRCN